MKIKSFLSALPIVLFEIFFFSGARVNAEVATPKSSPAASSAAEDDFSGVRDFDRISQNLNCDSKVVQFTDTGCALINWVRSKGNEYKLCQKFFSDDKGQLGPYGKAIASLIAGDIDRNRNESVFMQANPDFDISCPGFKTMTPMQKVAFHTWVFELTAHPESSCNDATKDNISSAVPTGRAVCLYQLEYPKAIREWRSTSPSKTNAIDPKTGKGIKYCAVPESQIRTLEGCTGCAFDDYKRHLLATGRPFGFYNDEANPKRVKAAQWAAQTRLNAKQTAEAIAYKKCRESNKCKGTLHQNERLAAYNFFNRLERFPLCKTPQAEEELKAIRAGK